MSSYYTRQMRSHSGGSYDDLNTFCFGLGGKCGGACRIAVGTGDVVVVIYPKLIQNVQSRLAESFIGLGTKYKAEFWHILLSVFGDYGEGFVNLFCIGG